MRSDVFSPSVLSLKPLSSMATVSMLDGNRVAENGSMPSPVVLLVPTSATPLSLAGRVISATRATVSAGTVASAATARVTSTSSGSASRSASRASRNAFSSGCSSFTFSADASCPSFKPTTRTPPTRISFAVMCTETESDGIGDKAVSTTESTWPAPLQRVRSRRTRALATTRASAASTPWDSSQPLAANGTTDVGPRRSHDPRSATPCAPRPHWS